MPWGGVGLCLGVELDYALGGVGLCLGLSWIMPWAELDYALGGS